MPPNTNHFNNLKYTKTMKTKTTRVRKVPIKSVHEIIANHAWSAKKYNHFAEEIATLDRKDNRDFNIIVLIVAILGIILLIVNYK